MSFTSDSPTPYDINFRMFGTPIRVSPWFFLMTAILGWDFVNQGLEYLAVWIVCVFVSILLHEFGHIWAGRMFGATGHIVLYSFGGLAYRDVDPPYRWQRIFISLAGPLIQLALYGVLKYGLIHFAASSIMEWPHLAQMALIFMLIINLQWALFNLLPIFPLDGGRITRELFEAVNPARGRYYSLGLSAVSAFGLALNALLAYNNKPHIEFLPTGGTYTIILFGMLAYSSYIAMQNDPSNRWSEPTDRAPWEQR